VSAVGTAVDIILTRVRGRALARRMAAESAPKTPVAVYFADAPESLYQLRRWYSTLEALSTTYPTGIIVSDPSTWERVRSETSVPVTFASGAPQLARVLQAQDVQLVLYPNHNALNFRVLRFARPVHVFIGHGDSGKESSVSRQLKAYDRTFVAHREAIELLRGIRGYDADADAVVVGSPWLGFLGAPPESWQPDGRTVVLYAPTWEGDRPSMDYSSVESSGEAVVAALLAAPGLRLIYRPHPWLGRVRPTAAQADARLRRMITAANNGGVVDTGDYGWSLAAADVCISDVSSVASDAEAMGKPVLLATELANSDAAAIRQRVEAIAAGPTSQAPSTSMDGLLAAVADALRIATEPTL
jgi:hypothetical protein